MARQHRGDSGDDRRVGIVAAGVAPVRDDRRVLAPRRLVQGQGIDVGPDEQCLPGVFPVEHGQHAGAADAVFHGESEVAHARCQSRSCPHFLEG